MRKYCSLVKRNCLVFLRDRSAVFFSLLSMLIVLILMGVFLGGMNVDSLTELLARYGGIRDAALDRENASHLVQYWTLAGILTVNAVTVTLTVIGVMVDDASENRLSSIYSAPVKRGLVSLSYITAAVLIGMLFCMLTLAASLVYICAGGGTMLSLNALGQAAGYTFLNVCIFAVIMYLAALFIKTSSAWSGVATIVGTLVGFLGAIYLPMGQLPQSVGNFLKYLPILHGTSLMRKACCADMISRTFEGLPGELSAGYQEFMGITVSIGDKEAGSSFQMLFLLGCGILALAFSIWAVKKKSISDR